MSVTSQRQLFTVEEYHKMSDVGILKPSDRVELVNGEIIKMSPIKSTHAGIVNYLLEYLIIELHTKSTIIGQNPLRLNEYSEPEPDVLIARYRADRYRSNHPTSTAVYLVIEVADSTLAYDRNIKKALYAEANIPEYWIVNIPEQQLEVFREPVASDYKIQEVFLPNAKLTCHSINFELDLKNIFTEQA